MLDLEAELPVEVVLRCKSLGVIRAVLRTIARMDKGKMATQNILIGSHLEDPVTAHADRDGKCRVEHHPLLRALEGVKNSFAFGECPICGQIYWAGRIDKPCCTRKCAGDSAYKEVARRICREIKASARGRLNGVKPMPPRIGSSLATE